MTLFFNKILEKENKGMSLNAGQFYVFKNNNCIIPVIHIVASHRFF